MQINKTENTLKGMTQPQREWFQSMKQRRDEKERLSVNEAKASGKIDPKDKRKQGAHEFNKKNMQKRKEDRRTPQQLAKARAMREIEKVSLVRAKLSKSHSRPGRLNSMVEDRKPEKTQGNKKRSKFLNDLTDTSQRGAKRLRLVECIYIIFFIEFEYFILSNLILSMFFSFRYEATKHKNTAKLQAKKKPNVPKKKTSAVKITNKSGKNKFNQGKNFGGPRKTNTKRKK